MSHSTAPTSTLVGLGAGGCGSEEVERGGSPWPVLTLERPAAPPLPTPLPWGGDSAGPGTHLEPTASPYRP